MTRWGLAEPDPIADAFEILDGDAASGAFSHSHDALADDVIGIRGKARLLAAAPLQQPFGALGALLLKFPPQLLIAVPDSLEGLAPVGRDAFV